MKEGEHWRMILVLVQAISGITGRSPPRLLWVIVILISKGGGDYHGIGLLEPMLKVFEQSMDHQLKAFELHNSLHGCHNGCGTGTAGIEAKLTQ